jgi:predicted transcriptional regulator
MRSTEIRVERVVAFDDIADLLRVLTEKRVLLLRQVKAAPGSISDLARTLKRDRSAVTRDVQVLERFGVLRVIEKPLPGHGRQKWIAPVARDIRLTAQL